MRLMPHLSSDGIDHFSQDSKLLTYFDAIVMLTWSDWHTEPRSNRYHYATRFARELPVLFVQPDSETGDTVSERVPGTNIDIVHVSPNYGPAQTAALNRELKRRRIFRPFLWIYNVFFEDFTRRSNANLKVYHATEDYLSPPDQWAAGDEVVCAPLIRQLRDMDLVVAVSEGVAESYQVRGGFEGETLVLPNGCDFAFWKESQASVYAPPPHGRPVALFQGGINARLDYDLLNALAGQMPDWDFWFCGHDANGGPGWKALRQRANVRYLGTLRPEDIADAARQSSVGLIPFKQDELIRRSLPLKAYEYAACGLPTVSVPINALSHDPDVFTIARTPDEFAIAIRHLADQRTNSKAVARRLMAAESNSYDKHFTTLVEKICSIQQSSEPKDKLNVLVLYESTGPARGKNFKTALSLEKHFYHNVFSIPVESLNSFTTSPDFEDYFDCFDAIVLFCPSSAVMSGQKMAAAKRILSETAGLRIGVFRPEDVGAVNAEELSMQLGLDAICVPEGPAWMVLDGPKDGTSLSPLPKLGDSAAATSRGLGSEDAAHRNLSKGGDPDRNLLAELDRYLAARLSGKAKAHLIRVPVLVTEGRFDDFRPLPLLDADMWHPASHAEESSLPQDGPAENVAPQPMPIMLRSEAGASMPGALPQDTPQEADQATDPQAHAYRLGIRASVRRALRPIWRILPAPLKTHLMTLYRLRQK